MISDRWYKNAVIYCCAIETFLDTDGDGVGDFEGMSRRLDYLQGLGVTAVWLMPFQPSPRRDHGYDITDYYGVDPRYGSLGDFVAFTHGANARGIGVIMDLVVNHTSDQHPWFRSAREGPDSPFHDWYVWADRKPPDAEKGIVFPGVQKTTWTRDARAGKYYFHRFYEFQPDLNFANPEVRTEILKIMGFWTQLGVAGFRLDAVPFVIALPDPETGKEKPDYELLREFREFVQWRSGNAVLLAEANVTPGENMRYFGDDGDRMQMMFNFHLNQHLFLALATGEAKPLADAITATRDLPATAQWALHLRNHDELDLGRLTEAERGKVFAAFGPEPEAQLYGRGIRRRLAPMLHGDRRRIELANSLLFTLPGTPVLRYGDEIGMGDDLSLPERECARTPMQWSDLEHGGFTRARKPTKPVIPEGVYGYRHVNVAAQRRDPESLLNWFERIIRMRKEVPEIGLGRPRLLRVDDPAVLAMRYDGDAGSVVFLHNLSDRAREISFRAGPKAAGESLVNLLSEDHSVAGDDGRHVVLLEGYGYRWFRRADADGVMLA
ncbi:alpha-amylase family protein [Amaricoccus solimangrovi]|uniref:Trehalose synthase n=1 Tax=Amaricoccus solimangrovi TaxID=2589815 RepID=A0A501WLN2_9RHOB|nr:alpha-amylase family protein [Amaricoccus solimangrovi]TPE49692.1 trehalose synthase [Amaricoccus solimangrovi]